MISPGSLLFALQSAGGSCALSRKSPPEFAPELPAPHEYSSTKSNRAHNTAIERVTGGIRGLKDKIKKWSLFNSQEKREPKIKMDQSETLSKIEMLKNENSYAQENDKIKLVENRDNLDNSVDHIENINISSEEVNIGIKEHQDADYDDPEESMDDDDYIDDNDDDDDDYDDYEDEDLNEGDNNIGWGLLDRLFGGESSYSNPPQGGSHESPREHWRSPTIRHVNGNEYSVKGSWVNKGKDEKH